MYTRGEIGHRHGISDEARDDRRVHHVRGAPFAEQELAGAAEAGARLRP